MIQVTGTSLSLSSYFRVDLNHNKQNNSYRRHTYKYNGWPTELLTLKINVCVNPRRPQTWHSSSGKLILASSIVELLTLSSRLKVPLSLTLSDRKVSSLSSKVLAAAMCLISKKICRDHVHTWWIDRGGHEFLISARVITLLNSNGKAIC